MCAMNIAQVRVIKVNLKVKKQKEKRISVLINECELFVNYCVKKEMV